MDEKSIFLAALEIAEPGERTAYLNDTCRDDPELRRRVEQLLAAKPRSGDFLELPPPIVVAAAEQLTADLAAHSDLCFLSPSTQPGALGRLGHYEILDVVGSGGFGIVLKAFDDKLHRVVAIKTLVSPLAASATARQRFVREARAAAAVRDDHVVQTHAVEDAGLIPYLVMEYIDGISLDERLRQSGPLKTKEILRIGLQTAQGLAAAHRQGLVHRDVKPANILLERGSERVKMTDFGLARAVDDASLTQVGIISGTPAFMSPEQARCAAIDRRSDLFSLGSVLYALCTGQSPFRASTSLGTIKRVCEDNPRPLREINSRIPNWLGVIIEKLLAKEPADRFQSADEVIALLSLGLAHVEEPNLLPPAVPGQQPSFSKSIVRNVRWPRWCIAAALVVLLTGFGLAEGTGASHVTATIVRILTPDGTLVVEVSEPGVSVTVDGNEGISITGAGLHELRLRPGKHEVRASKDGKPVTVDQPLVTMTQGGKQMVKVIHEERPLSRMEKLQHAAKLLAEIDRLVRIAEPLRSSDPWQAESPFREALAHCDQLVKDFPEVPRYRERQAACRFTLASTLGMQTHYAVFRSSKLSAAEISHLLAAASEATELLPSDRGMWSHLGRAHYRAGDWKAALAALEKGSPEHDYNGTCNRFFLAMTHWQLGNKEEARKFFGQAVQWMDAQKPNDRVLGFSRTEATELLAVKPVDP